ncbi:MAG: BTAD domain-containing putative transcriptional regulator [Cyanobacteria bacterium P01_F01_bin.53]
MRPSRQLRICLFGHLRVTFENQPIDGFQADRHQSLLAYFVLRARSPQPRSQLAALFWPNISDTKAKTNLRRELHRMKQVLPEPDQFLRVTTKTILWQPQLPFWLDVTEFETNLEQAAEAKHNPAAQVQKLQEAISLYQGGLLLTCYDDWIEPIRGRLQKRMITALVDLSRLLREMGDYRGAIAYMQQLLQLDPLNESGYLSLMQLHLQQGERASALQVYHQCMNMLRSEMGIAPSDPTRRFYEKLLLNDVSTVQEAVVGASRIDLTLLDESLSSSSEMPQIASQANRWVDWGEAPDIKFFYGRAEEASILQDWVMQQQCRLVVLLGIGGMGKTHLAAKVAHDLQPKYDFVFWRSLRNAPLLDDLLADLIPFISRQQESTYSTPRLIHWLRQSRCLVILDGMETLFKSGESSGRYQAQYESYSELFSMVGQASHKSCFLLTSREKPMEITMLEGEHLAVRMLPVGGSSEVSLALLERKQLEGTQAEKEQLCNRYACSPLILQKISIVICDVFSGQIALFLEEDVLLLKEVKHFLDHQFERLTLIEKTVMTWLAIAQDQASLENLKADVQPLYGNTALIDALESLCGRSLIKQQGNTYTQHPFITAYVMSHLNEPLRKALPYSVHIETLLSRAVSRRSSRKVD